MSTTKTTLEMPDALFRRAKALAATRGQSLKDLVTGALERELRVTSPVQPRSTNSALQGVRRLAEANAAYWQTDQDAVAAVRAQRRG